VNKVGRVIRKKLLSLLILFLFAPSVILHYGLMIKLEESNRIKNEIGIYLNSRAYLM